MSVCPNNLSANADSYYWDFGDGFTSTVVNPCHPYSDTGIYDITLIATTLNGCVDTFRIDSAIRVVDATLVPIETDLFIPTAFTPNGDGQNELFFVYGSNITTLSFKIYNEWGELIFISNNQGEGWDGKYKGQDAPEGNYVYVAKIVLDSGETIYKKGTLSLIR